MKSTPFRFTLFLFIFLSCLFFACGQKRDKAQMEKEADLELEKIPAVVMDGLKASFPKAEIQKWTKEKEGDIVIYDFEFRQEGQKFEADVKENGEIYNWEKEIAEEDLPEAVMKTVMAKYPDCTIKEIMEITMVMEGEDVLEGYEVVLETAEGKEVEVAVAPDGEVLEDSREEE